MGLAEYHRKRNFALTPEPKGKEDKAAGRSFVIQKHAASRLHYDFRLEMGGVLKSWAVPKGPSLDPAEKRLAVETEDHPVAYGDFEGIIPEGQYGGGTVLLWDHGTWIPRGDPSRGYRAGKLSFTLEGTKLEGGWSLVRIKPRNGGTDDRSWLLVKERDALARTGTSAEIVKKRPESVTSGRTLEQVAAAPGRVWKSNRKGRPSGKPPTFVPPQLATLVSDPPEGEDWLHELKLDGYRIMATLGGGSVTLWSRNGNDWTDRFSSIATALGALAPHRAVLDGEVVVLLPDGTTSFQALQNLSGTRAKDPTYFAFDLLELDGEDLRKEPLEKRREELANLLRESGSPRVRFSEHVAGDGARVLAEACRRGAEGIISKRRDSPYRSGRSKTWLKVKCHKGQELVVVGFTEPEGARTGLGALLLGVHEIHGGKPRLVYAGKVGTGFSATQARELRRKLSALERTTPACEGAPRSAKGVHWVTPSLVAAVRFTEWTRDGRLRHPTFEGLREDKPASDVVRERP